jgi:hypothetical protein
MVRALGYSNSPFDPADPGRLCRGRERWIDSFDRDAPVRLHRMVVSGAQFSDDSARDAFRGLSFSGLTATEVMAVLFPGKHVVACSEDAHPRQLPEAAQGVEHYELRRPGGPLARWAVRWSMPCSGPNQVDHAIAAGADVLLVLDAPPAHDDTPSPVVLAPLADGHLDPPHTGGLPDDLRSRVFLLSGYRMQGPPERQFQAAALPDLLEHCAAVVLVHEDKHSSCLGVYTAEPMQGIDAPLVAAAESVECLPVPFAIPPMLARWDRALWELRQDWDEESRGEYPVPPASDPSHGWSRRNLRTMPLQGTAPVAQPEE